MAAAASASRVGLGYPGSETAIRTANGICSNSSSGSVLHPLMNYPILLRVTRAAIEKIDSSFKEDSDRQSIDVKVVASDGQAHNLFGINTNLFGRVQSRINSNKPEHTFEVGTFVYDPSDCSFATYLEGESILVGCERTLPWDGKATQVREVSGFKATLLSGFICADSKHDFKSVSLDPFPEMLVLSMDVDRDGKWDLVLQQKKGEARPEEAQLFQEKMKTVSRKTLSPFTTCSITGETFREPVNLNATGGTYEKSALIHWANIKFGESIPCRKNPFERLLKKAGQLSEKLGGEGSEWTPAIAEEARRLEMLLDQLQLFHRKNMPAHLSGKDRAIWVLDFIKSSQIIQQQAKSTPVFVDAVMAARAEVSPVTQAIAKLFRATHTVV